MSPTSALLAEIKASSEFCDAAEHLLLTRCRTAIDVHGIDPADVAAALGVSRATLYRRMKHFGIVTDV